MPEDARSQPSRSGSAASRAQAEEVRVGWKMAGIGMTVATEVVAGALLGWLFDLWRGTGNIGVLVGSIAGICVGLWSMIRQSLKLNQQLERTAPTAGRGRPLPPERATEGEDDDDLFGAHDD